MRVLGSWRIVPIAATIALAGGATWWLVRPRPDMNGVVRRIELGQFQSAERQLREYLRAFPEDELARVMFAKVLVSRPEPDPRLALKWLDGVRPSDCHRAAMARAIEGDAHFWERRYDKAEAGWLESLRLEPTMAEVGWKLLNIYALQGRDGDSRWLGLWLFANEPDPNDRVGLLLQLIRHDAHAIEAASVVHQLEPVVEENPGDVHSAVALGRALFLCGQVPRGLALLRQAAHSHPDDRAAWSGYLDGLVDAADLDELVEALGQVPRAVAESDQFEVARGWLASQRRDLDGAIRAYRRALEVRPSDPVLAYRFKAVLRQAQRLSELAELEPRLEAISRFPETARSLFDRLSDLPDLGLKSHPEIFEEGAVALRQVGRCAEADAWARMARVQGRRLP